MANEVTTTKLWTTAELYPPATPPGLTDLLDAVVRGDRTESGKPALRRELTEDERCALAHRFHDLGKWTRSARRDAIAEVVLIMMVGFGKSETRDESAVRVTRYCEILADLPLWAIKRACDRFGAGEVTAEEIGEIRIMRGRAPSTDHLYMVAAALVAPLRREAGRVYCAMNGVVPKSYGEKSEADKERVRRAHEEFRARPALPDDVEAEERRREARERLAEEATAFSRAQVDAEYREAGIFAPTPACASLGLALKLGARVEDGPDGRNLTFPVTSHERGER